MLFPWDPDVRPQVPAMLSGFAVCSRTLRRRSPVCRILSWAREVAYPQARPLTRLLIQGVAGGGEPAGRKPHLGGSSPGPHGGRDLEAHCRSAPGKARGGAGDGRKTALLCPRPLSLPESGPRGTPGACPCCLSSWTRGARPADSSVQAWPRPQVQGRGSRGGPRRRLRRGEGPAQSLAPHGLRGWPGRGLGGARPFAGGKTDPGELELLCAAGRMEAGAPTAATSVEGF